MAQTTDEADALRAAIPGLPGGEWAVLGRGLWGSVYDLGDGSVLKVTAREGGIGDGAELFAREVRWLGALDGLEVEGLELPRLLASGSLPAMPAQAGWLRMTRLTGQPLARLDAAGQEAAARAAGAAVALLQRSATPVARAMEGLEDAAAPDRTDGLAAMIEDADLRAACTAAGETLRIAPHAACFTHGDINTVNLLIGPADMPIGLVDFAEAGLGAPERDLAHLQDFGEAGAAFLAGYCEAGGVAEPRRIAAVTAMNALASLAIQTMRGAGGERRAQLLREARAAAAAFTAS